MKYNQVPFFQVPRQLFKNHDQPAIINGLSLSAFKLYFWLLELEHRFTTGDKKKGKAEDYFFRSDAELSHDTQMSHGSVSQAKKELIALGIIQTWKMHWRDPETGKFSEKYVTAYRVRNI